MQCDEPQAQKKQAFTRFCLPFSYEIERATGGDPAATGRFVEVPPQLQRNGWAVADQEREAYFTPETVLAIFRLAKRFRFADGKADGEFTAFHTWRLDHAAKKVRKLTWRLRPPEILLFEGRDAAAAALAGKTGGGGPLALGLLMLDVEPVGNVSAADLLDFNERYRYVLPPFDGHLDQPENGKISQAGFLWGCEWQERVSKSDSAAWDAYAGRFARWLAQPFEVNVGGRTERFCLTTTLQNKARDSFRARCESPAKWDTAPEALGWMTHPDARAYVWTFLRTEYPVTPQDPLWCALLNVDGGHGSSISEFEREWVDRRTYTRWAHYGTLYGFCEHAGACLVVGKDEPVQLEPAFLSVYWDMAALMLYVRTALFRYSLLLAHASAPLFAADRRASREQRHRLDELRRSFVWFANLYRYPLLSVQQQAVEMYGYMQRAMDIGDIYKEVQDQIQTSHDYLDLEQDRQLNRVVLWAAIIGLIFGLLSIEAVQYFGAQTPDDPRYVLTFPVLLMVAALMGLAMYRAWVQPSRPHHGGSHA